jgi:hypothetical protein
MHSAEEFEGSQVLTKSYDSGVQVEYKTTWVTKKVYVCPRGIFVHRGQPGACGRMCKNAKSDDEDEFVDEDVLKTVAISKKTLFDSQLCFTEERG